MLSGILCCCLCADTDYLATPTRESMADITITEIGLENTLLLDAINKGKARFVSDCASYLQASACGQGCSIRAAGTLKWLA